MAFGVNLAVTTVALNVASYHKVIDLKELPISLSATLGLDPIHPDVMGWGSLVRNSIELLKIFLIF